MSAFDELRKEAAAPTRASPLPWLLLIVAAALALVLLVVGRNRLTEEQERTAAALKANDELHLKVRALEADQQKAQDAAANVDSSTSDLSKRVVTLELQNRALQQELARSKQAKSTTTTKKKK